MACDTRPSHSASCLSSVLGPCCRVKGREAPPSPCPLPLPDVAEEDTAVRASSCADSWSREDWQREACVEDGVSGAEVEGGNDGGRKGFGHHWTLWTCLPRDLQRRRPTCILISGPSPPARTASFPSLPDARPETIRPSLCTRSAPRAA